MSDSSEHLREHLRSALELEKRRYDLLFAEAHGDDLDHFEKILDRVLQQRRTLARDLPELLSPGELKTFRQRLVSTLTQVTASAETARRDAHNRAGDAMGGAAGPLYSLLQGVFSGRSSEKKSNKVLQRIDSEIRNLELEGKIAMNRPASTQITIGNLNLGTVIGDLNSSITTLSQAGEPGLAEGRQGPCGEDYSFRAGCGQEGRSGEPGLCLGAGGASGGSTEEEHDQGGVERCPIRDWADGGSCRVGGEG